MPARVDVGTSIDASLPDAVAAQTVKSLVLPASSMRARCGPTACAAAARHPCRPIPTARSRLAARPRLRRSLLDRGRRAHRRAVRRASAVGGRRARPPAWHAARASPDALDAQGRVGAADRARAASRGLPRGAVRHRGRGARARGAAPRARAAVRGQAPVRPAQGDERAQGRGGRDVRRVRRCGASSSVALGGPFTRARVRQRGDRLAAGRGGERRRARRRAALRGVGRAHAGRSRRAPGRRAVPRAAQARLHEARAARARRT